MDTLMSYFFFRLKQNTNIKMFVKNHQSADDVKNTLCSIDYTTFYIPDIYFHKTGKHNCFSCLKCIHRVIS